MTSSKDDRWPRQPVSEIAEVVGGGTPSTREPENFGGDIPWLTPKDLSDWGSRWVARGGRSITHKGLEESSARLLPRKTVLVSSRAPVGYVALAANDVATNQGFRSLVIKEDNVPEFFYYVMKSMRPALEAAASGTTFKEISGSAMKEVEVPCPPVRDQARVAECLGSLDDKIDSNRRLVSLLDEVVALEFDRRFFDGRREMPPDWSAGTLADLGRVRGGGTPRTKVPEYWDAGGIVWLTPRDMTALRAPVVYDSKRRISTLGLEESSARLLPKGTVLYTSRATLGYTAIASTELSTNQGFIAVEPADGFSSEFVLMALRSRREAIAAQANGSTFLEVSKTNFKKVSIALPPAHERAAFDEVAKPAFRWIEALDREAVLLGELRDSLMPALTSGWLRIPGVNR